MVFGPKRIESESIKEFKLSDGTFIDMEQADSIFPSLYTAPNSDGYDPDLPRNEVRVQSLIYALARARKSSGRLNKDDIERASLTLNLYGKSDRGIDASLQEVQREWREPSTAVYKRVAVHTAQSESENQFSDADEAEVLNTPSVCLSTDLSGVHATPKQSAPTTTPAPPRLHAPPHAPPSPPA